MTIPMASNSKIQHQNDDHASVAHHWKLEFYERGIQKGICACGAVKFYPAVYTAEYLERSKELNKKLGKPGDPNYHNEIKKEEIKTVKQEAKLPPIPPKPESIIPGRASGAAGMQLHKYYMANKDAIITYFNELGEDKTCILWGISPSGWRTLRCSLMPDKFPKPQWSRFKKEGKPKREYRKKEKPVKACIGITEIPEGGLSLPPIEEIPPNIPPITSAPEPRSLTEAEELYRQGLPTNRKFTGLQLDGKPEQKSEPAHNGSLPAFPAFNDNWPERTQCTWLLVYQELTGCAREKAASV